MMRTIVLTALLQGIFGCSSFSGGDKPTEIWKVDLDLGQEYLFARIGGLDSNHFYAVGRRSSSNGRFLVAYDRADGRVAWRGITTPVESIISAGGRVFAPGDILNAFEASTGRALWAFTPDSTLQLVYGTADASRVYAGSLQSAYAVDAATGALLWKRSIQGPWVRTRLRTLALSPEGDLLVSFDAEYVFGGVQDAAVVIAVDPATGQERWRFQDGGETTYRSPRGLTIYENLVLYSDSYGSEAVAFDRTTRQVVWRAPWTPSYLGSERAPLVVDGVAYFSDGFGQDFAVDARTGARRWSVKPSPGGSFSHEVCGPLFLVNNGPVQILGRDRGDSRGRLLPDNETALMMATDGNQAFVSTTKGVYAFDCGS